jgi:hypothetical protein
MCPGVNTRLNPTRGDRSKGSFSINLRSGVWSDLSTNESGADLISLYAYINGLSQINAAKEIVAQVGIAIDDAEPKPGPRSNVIPIKQPDAVPEQEATSKHTLWRPILPVPNDAGLYPLAHFFSVGQFERISKIKRPTFSILKFHK